MSTSQSPEPNEPDLPGAPTDPEGDWQKQWVFTKLPRKGPPGRAGCILTAAVVLVAIGLILVSIGYVGIRQSSDPGAEDGPSIEGAGPGAPAAESPVPGPAEPCDARNYHGTPAVTVSMHGPGASPGTVELVPDPPGQVILARTDFWVRPDCTVDMELVWQERQAEDWCYILVATGTGRSSPRELVPREISGRLAGGTTAIDVGCPGMDHPGDLDVLFGGGTVDPTPKGYQGQVGSYLSQASTHVSASIVGPSLTASDLVFTTGRMTFDVDIVAEEQEGAGTES